MAWEALSDLAEAALEAAAVVEREAGRDWCRRRVGVELDADRTGPEEDGQENEEALSNEKRVTLQTERLEDPVSISSTRFKLH